MIDRRGIALLIDWFVLQVTCPSLAVAESMADLVDGYCRLVNSSSTSIWNRKGEHPFLPPPPTKNVRLEDF
jgi:hypothetical protein